LAAAVGRVGVDTAGRPRCVVGGDALLLERAPVVDVGPEVDVELVVEAAVASVVVVAARTRRGPLPDRSRALTSAAPHPATKPTTRAIAHPFRLGV
jgi:hypothetical protein